MEKVSLRPALYARHPSKHQRWLCLHHERRSDWRGRRCTQCRQIQQQLHLGRKSRRRHLPPCISSLKYDDIIGAGWLGVGYFDVANSLFWCCIIWITQRERITLKMTPKVTLKMSLKDKSSDKFGESSEKNGGDWRWNGGNYRRGLLKLYVSVTKGDSHSLGDGDCRFFENKE